MYKILLVDDSKFSRNSLKLALGEDYTFIEAENGTNGLELFTTENPDLVILDLTMPDMNGLQVLENIKQIAPAARVVINTADIQDFNKSTALELGASGFLNKPIKVEKLRELVQSILTA